MTTPSRRTVHRTYRKAVLQLKAQIDSEYETIDGRKFSRMRCASAVISGNFSEVNIMYDSMLDYENAIDRVVDSYNAKELMRMFHGTDTCCIPDIHEYAKTALRIECGSVAYVRELQELVDRWYEYGLECDRLYYQSTVDGWM